MTKPPPSPEADDRDGADVVELDPVERVMRRYAPDPDLVAPDVWQAVRPATLDDVRAVGIDSVHTARVLVRYVARYRASRLKVGLTLDPRELWHPNAIEDFIQGGDLEDLADSSRTSIRAHLHRVGSAVGPLWPAGPEPIGRDGPSRPLSASELVAKRRRCLALPTREMRMKALAMLASGAGAGLAPRDQRHLRGTHVTQAADGTVEISVKGNRPRTVAVLDQWATDLLAAAQWAGDDLMLGGNDPHRKNVTSRIIRSLKDHGGREDGLDPNRLRNTWIVTHLAAGTRVAVLTKAAGVKTLQNLSDLLEYLPDPGWDEARAELRHPGGAR